VREYDNGDSEEIPVRFSEDPLFRRSAILNTYYPNPNPNSGLSE